jgi:anti-anti-sigma factor
MERCSITLFDELDTASAPVLRDCLAHLVNEGATHLEVDVSELEFIDSTGLTVVMEQWHRLQTRGGLLYLLSPAPAIQKTLDITGLAPFLLNSDPAGLFEGRQVTPHARDELRVPDGASGRADSAAIRGPRFAATDRDEDRQRGPSS